MKKCISSIDTYIQTRLSNFQFIRTCFYPVKTLISLHISKSTKRETKLFQRPSNHPTWHYSNGRWNNITMSTG